jgi:hypothetical protein
MNFARGSKIMDLIQSSLMFVRMAEDGLLKM